MLLYLNMKCLKKFSLEYEFRVLNEISRKEILKK